MAYNMFDIGSPSQQDDGEETFIQRQKRLAGQDNAALGGHTGSAFHAGNATPVMGNGKIPDPVPQQPHPALQTPHPERTTQQQPAPAQIPAPAPAPAVAPTMQPTGTAIGAGDWSKLGINPAQATPGMAIPGQPGKVLAHNGYAWEIRDAGQQPATASAIPTQQPPQPQPQQTQGQQQPVQATNGPAQQIAGSPVNVPWLGNDPFVTYKGYDYKTDVSKPGALPGSYAGTDISQFASPDQSGLVNRENNLMSAILDNPRTLNDAVVGQMKEKAKEGSLLMEQQLGQQAREVAAARGLSSGGGLGGTLADIKSSLANDVLASNRDIDLQAAAKGREDELAALNAVEGILSGQMGRATQGFGATLAGQTAKASDARNVSQDAIQRAISGNAQDLAAAELGLKKEGMQAEEGSKEFSSNRAAQDAALDRILKQYGMSTQAEELRRANEALGVQKSLGEGGLALDRARLDSSNSQFEKNYGLNVLDFLERQRQANNNLGFNYTQLGQNSNNAMLDYISRILG